MISLFSFCFFQCIILLAGSLIQSLSLSVKMPMKEKTRKSPARCISISLDLTQLIPEPFDESVVWKMFTFCLEQAVEVDASQCLHVPFT